jgi:hypothetical protein
VACRSQGSFKTFAMVRLRIGIGDNRDSFLAQKCCANICGIVKQAVIDQHFITSTS